MTKKICSILILIVLLLNSSLLSLVSLATEATSDTSSGTQGKISMSLSRTQFTNKTQGELVITGILERTSEDSILYENPLITFEFPEEVEKVVINDQKLLYDTELSIHTCIVETNESGNQVIKVQLAGKQTKTKVDELTKGTNIVISANVILKQDIETKDTSIKMTCTDGAATPTPLKLTVDVPIKVVNPTELVPSTPTDDENQMVVERNGIKLNINPIHGDKTLENGETIYSNEIVKYEINITNTSQDVINNLKLMANIPDGMVYVDYLEENFEFWDETYTAVETLKPDKNGVYWQDDTYQYTVDESIKDIERTIETLQPGETKTISYELKANTDTEIDAETNIEFLVNDNYIYTFNMRNTLKPSDIEVRMRQYQSRMEKNNFEYNIIIKNLSDEAKSGTINFTIPNNVEVTSVDAIYAGEGAEANYEVKDGKISIVVDNIEPQFFRAFTLNLKVNIAEETTEKMYEIKVSSNFENSDGNIYRANECIATGGIESVSITQSSETSGERIEEFNEIIYTYEITNTGYTIDEWGGYTSVVFEDYLPNELSIQELEYNNFKVTQGTDLDNYFIIEYNLTEENVVWGTVEKGQANGRDNTGPARIKLNLNIKNGETITIKIVTETRAFDAKQDNIEIANSALVSGEGIKTKQSNIIQNTLYHPDTTNIIDVDSDGNVTDGEDKPIVTPPEDDNNDQPNKTYSISGLVWNDDNENGIKDSNESKIEGVTVSLYDVTNNKFVTDDKGNRLKQVTQSEGTYAFTNLPKGEYYVVFEYDTEKYKITDYQIIDSNPSENNDAIEKSVNIDGEVKNVGITNTIDLITNYTNIDMGLSERKTFDLKIEQFVEKITVNNSKGTKEYNFDDEKFAKIEIHSKQIVGSTVIIEYKIRVTNVGDLDGKVYEILEEIPSTLDFHSELNDGWTVSLSNTYSNVSFANKNIASGESIEATFILSKTLDADSAGKFVTTAKLGTTESSKYTEDMNSENNSDSVEVLIAVATGFQIALRILGSTILGGICIVLLVLFMRKIIVKKRLFVLFMVIFATSMFAFNTKGFAYSIDGTIADAQAQAEAMVQDAVMDATANLHGATFSAILSNFQGSGTGVFKIYDHSGNLVGEGKCGKPGAHFHTDENCHPVDENDPTGPQECDGRYYEWSEISVPVVYNGPTGISITSTTVTVSGDDFPEGANLSWTNEGLDFSIDGDIPGSFTDAESEAVWNAIAGHVDASNMTSFDGEAIESIISGGAGLDCSVTAVQLEGSAGATSLSVTISRTIHISITICFSWTDQFVVSPEYVCPGCGQGQSTSQPINVPESACSTLDLEETFSTTITFTPPELPKSLTIFKYDEDTGEILYDPSNPGGSGFKFRVEGDGQTWEVGVGETITGLHAGTYTIYEIESPYGYGVWEDNYNTGAGNKKVAEVTINSGDIICIVKVANKKEFINLKGYVWEDMLDGKDNTIDSVYTGGTDKRVEGVKVTLYDTVRGTSFSTFTDANGEYSFGSRNADLSYSGDTLRIEDLASYYVEFEYNGVKYRNVELNKGGALDSSKAAEEDSVRESFNNKFETITSNTQMDASGNSTGTVVNASATINYNKSGDYESKVNYGSPEAYGDDVYHIIATSLNNCNIADLLSATMSGSGSNISNTTTIEGLNLGLYVREQVDLALDSDVARFDLAVNNYHHIYKYGTIVDPNKEEEMGVKLKALKDSYYERPLHESTIVYSADDGTTGANGNVYADITYKIYLQNKSNTLSAKIREITINYGSQLSCISYNYEGEPAVAVTDPGGTGEIKELTLDLTQLGDKTIEAKNRQVIEITLRADAKVIAEILNDATALNTPDGELKGIKFDFMAEIKTYSTYADNEVVPLQTSGGLRPYASIDSNSAPRNARVETDPNDNNRFKIDTFENDTTIAPTFILTKGSQTSITGTVYEDSADKDLLKDNERLGNGTYDEKESVMSNVKVELLLVPVDANEMYDSTMARDNVTSKHNYQLAKLYKTNNDGTQTEIGDAVTWTDENGNYSFEGVVADNYVIRYTYGENIGGEGKNTYIYNNGEQVKQEPIKAREYKSTIITSDYIRKAINTANDGIPHLNGDWAEGNTDVSWFLNNNTGTRYSDAVDDIEYRAYFEQYAKLNNENINDSSKYAYSEMEAYTPYMRLGVEQFNDQNVDATLTTQENGTIDYEYNLQNMDFGLIERPLVELEVDKQITNLTVTLGNGQVPIKGNPSDPNEDIPYVRTGIDDFVPIEMDTELTEGATIEEEYTISVSNNSELDYPIYQITSDTDVANERNYYFYGEKGNNPVTVRIGTLVDYLTPEIDVDLDELKRSGWEVAEMEDLIAHKTTEATGEKTYRLITEEVEKELEDGKYIMFMTDAFSDENDSLVKIGETKSISYNVSKLLTTSDEMKYTNDVEILEYIGYTQNKDKTEVSYDRVNVTTPGNLIPEYAKETDEDSVRTTITPPTGVIISKTLYITTAGLGLIILVVGVLFIKRKVLIKNTK